MLKFNLLRKSVLLMLCLGCLSISYAYADEVQSNGNSTNNTGNNGNGSNSGNNGNSGDNDNNDNNNDDQPCHSYNQNANSECIPDCTSGGAGHYTCTEASGN
ncbi:hypothetical protein J3369_15420 [Alteromonas sp. NFXS44]|uniref:hypothetical protein n=1 Tax=Alteromonas sp. NFXS44 TaxID=2818435 RepID=UPI0032DF9773